jgi:hypothetical protein
MAILRHTKIAMTMEIYTQVPDKNTRDALKKLSDFLADPKPPPRRPNVTMTDSWRNWNGSWQTDPCVTFGAAATVR